MDWCKCSKTALGRATTIWPDRAAPPQWTEFQNGRELPDLNTKNAAQSKTGSTRCDPHRWIGRQSTIDATVGESNFLVVTRSCHLQKRQNPLVTGCHKRRPQFFGLNPITFAAAISDRASICIISLTLCRCIGSISNGCGHIQRLPSRISCIAKQPILCTF